MPLPRQVTLVEVGPRDGLQNHPFPVTTEIKLELIERLTTAGIRHIETASFVSPKWVPSMADSTAVMARLKRRPGVIYSGLVPNLKGMEAACAAEMGEIGLFVAATESFSQKNTNCSIDEAFARAEPVVERARDKDIRIRGYISVVLGCPYEGDVSPRQVARIARRLLDLGCDEISLGDTIGRGTPLRAQEMASEVIAAGLPVTCLAAHFHDTYGQALANLFAVLQLGVSIIDSSVAGLGGCPYARGATGNVATEDVLYLLQGLDIETGIELEQVVAAGQYICAAASAVNQSRVGKAISLN